MTLDQRPIYCIVGIVATLYCTILALYCVNTMQYNTIQNNTIQYNAIQYNTIQFIVATLYCNDGWAAPERQIGDAEIETFSLCARTLGPSIPWLNPILSLWGLCALAWDNLPNLTPPWPLLLLWFGLAGVYTAAEKNTLLLEEEVSSLRAHACRCSGRPGHVLSLSQQTVNISSSVSHSK